MVSANEWKRTDPECLAGARRKYDRDLALLHHTVETLEELTKSTRVWYDQNPPAGAPKALHEIHHKVFTALYRAKEWLRITDKEPTDCYLGNMAAFGEYEPPIPYTEEINVR